MMENQMVLIEDKLSLGAMVQEVCYLMLWSRGSKK